MQIPLRLQKSRMLGITCTFFDKCGPLWVAGQRSVCGRKAMMVKRVSLSLRFSPSFALALVVLLAFASPAWAAGSKKTRTRTTTTRVASTGLITHTAPTEQAVMTPVPIWVESRGEAVTRVILRYKSFGSPSWTAIDLTKSEAGWSGEVPCRDVETITGVLRYYVTAYDAEGN